MNINLARLGTDLTALAREAILLKRALRTTWTRPMAEEQRALVRLRRRTTELCVLRAFLRGRRHLQRPLREGAYPGMTWDGEAWHAKVAERVAKDYAVDLPERGESAP